MNKKAQFVKIAGAILFTVVVVGSTFGEQPTKPSKKEKCPVCGMFVYKYPDWVGIIAFNDDTRFYFDGAKDLFKYYFNLKKYNPGKKHSDVISVQVTEYYDMTLINAFDAFFVAGSDVYGPMGRELIPLATRQDAKTFARDHRGKQILRFKDITPAVINKLD